MHSCPMCRCEHSLFYFQDKNRTYYQCSRCELVFVDPKFLPDINTEKQEYDLHRNHPGDQGYKTFLNRVARPLVAKLQPGSKGLDFGCGPSPVLASMLTEQGFPTQYYDPIYFDNKPLLGQTYKFVTCTEAIEHFHYPFKEWQLLLSLLDINGLLAVMTKRVLDRERFATWHYKNDMTHVSFFSETTFIWLADKYGLNLEIVSDDVVLFRIKSPAPR